MEAVYVSIRDEQGNLLESDYALENPEYTEHWGYITATCIPSGTRITISVQAMDELGGVGVRSCQMRIP